VNGGPKAYLFRGCIQEVGFAETNEATRHLLEEAGYEVAEVPAWTCCGALHRHFGDVDFALRLARRNIEAFPEDGIIVSNAGGCGAALLEYREWFAEDPLEERARRFSSQVRDLSQALLQAPRRLTFRKRYGKIAYQPSCHLRFVQGVEDEPLTLLRQVAEEVVDLGEGLSCCGSAGIYSLLQPEMSRKVLARKETEIPEDVERIVTANPGCAMQVRLVYGGKVPVVQLPEYLLEWTGGTGLW